MNWNNVQISEIGLVFNGKTPSKTEQRNTGEPILKIKDIDSNGNFSSFDSFVDKEFYEKNFKRKLEEGDTLFLNAAHNSTHVVSKNYYVPKALEGIIPTGEWLIVRGNNENANKRFLNYYLTSPQGLFYIKDLVKGIHLYPKDVKRIMVPLPPLETQKKIAEILDRADALLQQDKKIIEKYDQLTQSVFLDMFGDPALNQKEWPFSKLGDNIDLKSQNGLYVPKECYTTVDGIEMVHMSDAFYGIVQRGTMKRVKISLRDVEKYSLEENNILIARRSLNYEGAAKPCRIPYSIEPLVYESSLIRIKLNQKKVNPLFFYYYMSNERARQKYVYKHVTKSTISGINNQGLNQIKIYLPPVRLQNLFATIVEKIEEQKQLAQKSLEKSEELFQSLLQRAFKGKLV